MPHGLRTEFASGRVDPFVPVGVVLAGVVALALGYRAVGIGVVVGSVLAVLNGVFLSRRVDFAADMATVGTALLIMQLGLLVTCAIIAIVTIVLVHFSIAAAVAAAAGFAVAQLAGLASFYWRQGRIDVSAKGEAL